MDAVASLNSALADRYRIVRELGAGGMATVYLADDLRHSRKVAIKVVHPELAAVIGAERFLAEIRTTASLQHPHILALFDSGQVEATDDSGGGRQLFYVMPYVEGESLRDRLTRERQLPVNDALRIAREVASALDYAHRHGVVHRDIKPENVLLHDGSALVADFGIALAVSQASGQRLTQTGLSLGTPAYMSPEQAMGERHIDARTDVYSLGAVLYEMLAGQPPFTAASAQAVIAKVLTEKAAPVTASRDSVPPHVARAIERALAKLAADRFSSAAEFAAALSDVRATADVEVQPGRGSGWNQLSIGLAGVSVVLLASTLWLWMRDNRRVAPMLYDVGLPDSASIVFDGSLALSVSPMGDFVVYAGGQDSTSQRLWLRSLIDGKTRPLDGTDGATQPRISPDGQWIAFASGLQIKIMPTTGGAPRVLAEAHNIGDLRWYSATRLYVVDDDGNTIRWLDAQVGQTAQATTVYCVGAERLSNPEQFLCGGGGRKYAFLLDTARATYLVLNTAPADRAAGLDLVNGTHFRVVDDRYVVFMSTDGDLLGARFDRAGGRIGRPVRLITGIRRESYAGVGQFDISSNGTLVYVLGENAGVGRLVRGARGSAPQPLPLRPGAFLRFDLSPDNKRLAMVEQTAAGQELRIYELLDGRQHTWLSAQLIGQPVWSPKGDRVATTVIIDRGGAGQRAALVMGSPDVVGVVDTLITSREYIEPLSWPLDSLLLGQDWHNIAVVAADTRTRPPRIDTLARGAEFGSLSPNGRLLAYYSTASSAIVIAPMSARDRRTPVTREALEAQWLSANQLLYRTGSGWWRVDVDPQTGAITGPAGRWYSDPRFTDTPGWSQHTTRDEALIYVQGAARNAATFIRVVPNWVSFMKRAVDASR